MESATQPQANVLFFELDGTRYGLMARDVVEVVRAVAIVPLPKAPPVIEGVINLRGAVVPVLDLRRRFDLALRELDPRDHFIVVTIGTRTVALRVDHVTGLDGVAPTAIEPATAFTAKSVFIAGVVKLPDGLALIHDVEKFLGGVEAAMLDSALASHPAGAER